MLRPPWHGELLLNGQALQPGDAFVQVALEQHLLVYSHDGSETDSVRNSPGMPSFEPRGHACFPLLVRN